MSNYRYPFHPGYPYHIYNRGFEKQNIFFSDRDYVRFLEGLQLLLGQFSDIQLHAFCLLPNHFHCIMTALGEGSRMSDFMHRWQLGYTMYAKTKYPEDIPRGPFFEGRFCAKLLDDDQYLSRCLSYVTYNAIKHELVTDIRDWPWTSYHQIVEGLIQPQLPQVTLIGGGVIGEYVDLDEE